MQPFISLFTAGEDIGNNTNSASSDMHLYVRLSLSILHGDTCTQVTPLKYLSYWHFKLKRGEIVALTHVIPVFPHI